MKLEELDEKVGEWGKATGVVMSLTQHQQLLSLMGGVFNSATAAEREACHKVAEDHYRKHETLASKHPEVGALSKQQMVAAGEIATKIRDRSSPRI